MSLLPPPEKKAAYVERMFAQIAPEYDRINRAMTFGLDQSWRLHAVAAVAPPVAGRALDVGTGTGDFLPLLGNWMLSGIAVGVDFCAPMMQEGWAKLGDGGYSSAATPASRLAFVGGDALKLPFPDNCFDAITTGFLMRNVVDIVEAFREMWRVARSGGMLACLEVARPRNPVLRLGHRYYFEQVVPWIGVLFGGDQQAYQYLPQSARAFPSPPELAQMMQTAGWQHVAYRHYNFGAVAIHTGVKL